MIGRVEIPPRPATVNPPPLSLGIHGASGRMGRRLIALIGEDPTLSLGRAFARADGSRLGPEPLAAVVDFSTPVAALEIAESCASANIPLVIGTTGLEADDHRRIGVFSQSIPILVSANFSKAVNLLFRLVGQAAAALGDSADIEIVERHHHFKKDAPSGTALRIAEVAGQAIGSSNYVHGRSGQVGERPRGEIGLHALRVGDNPGEHTVVFGLVGESLEISHRALNRDGFARGALDAAKFLAGKPPGLYSMDDLLG